ncbi:hypothetical protein [Mycobacterium sp. pW045]|uniref:hypothetical protein n=1 Tax=Mycobacterium sp. pW045 TaxID=3238984 RepID=UPI00351B4C23
MPVRHRVIALLVGAAAALLGGAVMPAALAHAGSADSGPYETCDGATCLVMAEYDPDTWVYSGFRPYFTDWKGEQAYNVAVTEADGSTVNAGSYDIKVEDYWSPFLSSSTYTYGDFTPTGEGADAGAFADLSGTTVYSTTFGDVNQVTINDAANGASYWIVTTPGYVNTVVTLDGASQDYIQYAGDAAPTFLWNSLDNPSYVAVPDYLIPDDPWAGLDFDPGEYGAVA